MLFLFLLAYLASDGECLEQTCQREFQVLNEASDVYDRTEEDTPKLHFLKVETEKDITDALGLPYIEPELRNF
jgi:hypothetical protein